jgi:CDP-paratose 2-epimerase
VEENRSGDHICYYSDLRKMRSHYPKWNITQSLVDTVGQIVDAWQRRQGLEAEPASPLMAVLQA